VLVTSHLFEAYLKCHTKCFLLSLGGTGTGNRYSDWVRAQQASYLGEEIKRLTQEAAKNQCVIGPINREDAQSAKWRFAVETTARAQNLESTIHVVERLTSEGQDKLELFIPIRFIFTNKLHEDAKLLLAFDAFVLSELLGREVGLGKIVHGDNRATLKVNTSALISEVRRVTEKIGALLSSNSPPELILNRHCPECEFQNQCNQKAVQKDELSLLSGITETERQSHRSKGIFTVTQLSYTFRPRRAPKRAKNPATPHHFALQALAIRENTDFFTGYDSLKCAQQKCLIHLIRDMNEDLLGNGFDNEYKEMVQRFAHLLQQIVETVDKYGLTRRHFRRHRDDAVRFLKSVEETRYSSPIATKYQERMGKYGSRLFTFLNCDGVPWNNNNAEHAIKGFARVRRFADGRFTEDSIREYLVMLSVAETCGYQNVEVLEFLLALADNSSACRLSLQ
jgi:hypothetical protein